jgi:ABC-type transport system involved in multi-copper enzyme maturation permease subunit
VSIADEIEGKTAITLLSKPINRRNFILGKYLGIMASILLLFILLTIIFYVCLYLKAGFEARETASDNPPMEERLEMLDRMTPGVVLSFMQVSLLTALSVAFSTRLPIHWNITLCIAIYLLGNLTGTMVEFSQQNQGQFPAVEFMAKVFAVVMPALGYFTIGTAISTDATVPWVAYVLPSLLYCILYTSFALVLAFLLFEDRDLA